MPCDLCTVSAHASLRGTCSLSAYAFLPALALNSPGPTANTRPLSNATSGQRGNARSASATRRGWIRKLDLCLANSVSPRATNPLTTPRLPLTSASSTFLMSTTCAPSFRVSVCGAWQFLRSTSSTAASSPASRASNITASPGSFKSSSRFSASTLALTLCSLVGRTPSALGGKGLCRDRNSEEARPPTGTSPPRTSRSASTSVGSFCLSTFVSSTARKSATRHASQSNANGGPPLSFPFETGGSW
mmetsp:Transcript_14413/g.61825  ORF Transcript_14413/g.61825 Transcript_14413/m.61825 type:complete len:246 (+) Transcript_14413:584-1321(+)